MNEIKGLKELNAQLEKLKGININKALLKGAYVLQKASMQYAPVKTGFLRQSHESSETDEGAEMRVNAWYAELVEFGTSKWVGKPFVRPAIETEKNNIVEAVAKELKNDMEDLVK